MALEIQPHSGDTRSNQLGPIVERESLERDTPAEPRGSQATMRSERHPGVTAMSPARSAGPEQSRFEDSAPPAGVRSAWWKQPTLRRACSLGACHKNMHGAATGFHRLRHGRCIPNVYDPNPERDSTRHT